MKLKNILEGLEFEVVQGSLDTDIMKIEYDSRKLQKGDLFICIKGYETDGHKYLESAVEKGIAAVLCMDDVKADSKVTVIKVKDTRKAMAVAGSNYFGNPKDKLNIIGVTGTNGKTTSTFMIKSILEAAGFKTGIIGTIANYIGDKKIETSRTTPESLELHKLFADMVYENVKYVVMEVSSHSLYLCRVYGINFCEGIFTNLTRDHLDFHKTFENYYSSKLMLFDNSRNSSVNIDSEYGIKVMSDIKGNKISYGIDNKADVIGKNLVMDSRGVEFDLEYKGIITRIKLNIPGKYNVENALGSAAACLLEGISPEIIKEGLEKMLCVPGRCEIVTHGYNLGFDIIVDYAHTPDGLENILKTAREFTSGKLISVFGCGGDRDKTKRPIMGEIGTRLSDLAVITSDNPRTEDPELIIKDILSGIEKQNYIVEVNRIEAIATAIKNAKKGDVIVIAGKGHEDYQVLKTGKIHFDEREIVKNILDKGVF
ncbi:MAG: UDP-N-acetylmuramoyl-L-alanyl-D-glutamate--2,6-diaminopimelate ligase [Solirubrobacterales bacterium]